MAQRTVVMGKGSLAIRVATWFQQTTDYEVAAVVPVVPEPAWAPSFMDWARSAGLPVVSSGSYADLPDLESPAWRSGLAFSVFYDRILPKWFLDRFGRTLNLHNGPLPRYRGVSPINWALKNGERSHGVTIHEVTPGIDDGPIVAQVSYPVYPEVDEVRDVYERALEYGWTLFEQTMPILDRITPVEQDESVATYYSADQNSMLGERRSFTRLESSPPDHG